MDGEDFQAGSGPASPKPAVAREAPDEIPQLELALLRRGVIERTALRERCGRCRRTPLMGERVYIYDADTLRCELCAADERQPPVASRMMHGPELGHTIRIAPRSGA